MQPWKTLSRDLVLKHNEFLSVESHRVQLPDGRVIPDWGWVVTPDYVNMVAVTEDDRFLFMRQTKYAVGEACLALPGGYIEPGEAPLEAGARELREESGYASDDWATLGAYHVDSNRGAGVANLCLARSARKVGEPTDDDLEEQELVLLSRAETETALDDGAFKVLVWATGVALALRRLA